jgi:hypothetical protein
MHTDLMTKWSFRVLPHAAGEQEGFVVLSPAGGWRYFLHPSHLKPFSGRTE